MLVKTIFAGFGGQGVLSMGLSLAQSAMREGIYLPSVAEYAGNVPTVPIRTLGLKWTNPERGSFSVRGI